MMAEDLWIDQALKQNRDRRDQMEDVAIAIQLDEARIDEKFKLYDHLDIVWLTTSQGRDQALIWPMLLHKHDQDCGRT